MNYYEELGLPRTASSEEIRQAYWRLARLLHPDQQKDEKLRRLAECQMKRLNRLYAILSDPEHRRRYDLELADPPERRPPIIVQVRPGLRFLPRRYAAAALWLLAGVMIIAGLIWLLTTDSVRSGPRYESARLQSETRPSVSLRPEAKNARRSSAEAFLLEQLAATRSALQIARDERDRARKELAKIAANVRKSSEDIAGKETTPLNSEPPDRGAEEPAASSAAQAAARTTSDEAPAKKDLPLAAQFAGAWLYAKPKLEEPSKLPYPPEFIEAVIVEKQGDIRGRYRARYRVNDRAISPDVSFTFEGKPKDRVAHMVWTGRGGARGEVQLKLLSASSMELIWSATVMGHELGLGSGAAILTRRPEP